MSKIQSQRSCSGNKSKQTADITKTYAYTYNLEGRTIDGAVKTLERAKTIDLKEKYKEYLLAK